MKTPHHRPPPPIGESLSDAPPRPSIRLLSLGILHFAFSGLELDWGIPRQQHIADPRLT